MLIFHHRSAVERSFCKCHKLPGRAVASLKTWIMPTETHLKILKYIEFNPEASQRELAHELGVSVGKVNYCLRALIDKGFVKAGNFKRNTDKLSYLYILTPKGLEEKASLTASFLKRKIAEHEKITQEIAQLKRDTQ